MLKRRSFLASILAAGVAPAFVRAGVLMPVKEIWVPEPTSVTLVSQNGIWAIDPIKTTMPPHMMTFHGSRFSIASRHLVATITMPQQSFDGNTITLYEPFIERQRPLNA